MRSGNILQFSKSWLKMVVLLVLFVSLFLVGGKMGVIEEVGEVMLMLEEEEGNLIHARGVKFDFEEVGSEDLQMINEEKEGWKDRVENDTADAKIEESDEDEQVKGRSEESTGPSGGHVQDDEEEEEEEDEEEEEERVFVSNTDPWLEYRYNFALFVVCL